MTHWSDDIPPDYGVVKIETKERDQSYGRGDQSNQSYGKGDQSYGKGDQTYGKGDQPYGSRGHPNMKEMIRGDIQV